MKPQGMQENQGGDSHVPEGGTPHFARLRIPRCILAASLGAGENAQAVAPAIGFLTG